MTTPSAPMEYWFHEDDNFSPSAARQKNEDSGFGEHKWKIIPYVKKSAYLDRLADIDVLEHSITKLKAENERLKEEHRIWEKLSLLDLLKQRDELKVKVKELEQHLSMVKDGGAFQAQLKERDELKAENERLKRISDAIIQCAVVLKFHVKCPWEPVGDEAEQALLALEQEFGELDGIL